MELPPPAEAEAAAASRNIASRSGSPYNTTGIHRAHFSYPFSHIYSSFSSCSFRAYPSIVSPLLYPFNPFPFFSSYLFLLRPRFTFSRSLYPISTEKTNTQSRPESAVPNIISFWSHAPRFLLIRRSTFATEYFFKTENGR